MGEGPFQVMKLGELDQLIGETITSYRDGSFVCASGRRFELDIEDDGCGGNDSHAFVSGSDMLPILGRVITDAYPKDCSSYGANLMFEAAGCNGVITIEHDHNGYYGFSWSLREIKP